MPKEMERDATSQQWLLVNLKAGSLLGKAGASALTSSCISCRLLSLPLPCAGSAAASFSVGGSVTASPPPLDEVLRFATWR